MFAMLGEITFELLSGPDAMATERRWDYAEHTLVEGPAKLQWIADGLETVNLEMLFHQAFGDPAGQVDALIAAASDHQARALVFANGTLQGYFVIIGLAITHQQMSDRGDPVATAVRVALKQWAFSAESGGQGFQPPLVTPLAAVTAPSGANTGVAAVAGAAGISAEVRPSTIGYSSPDLPTTGVSALMTNGRFIQTPASGGLPDDVSPTTIVRAGV